MAGGRKEFVYPTPQGIAEESRKLKLNSTVSTISVFPYMETQFPFQNSQGHEPSYLHTSASIVPLPSRLNLSPDDPRIPTSTKLQ